jgi:hypothetical protein
MNKDDGKTHWEGCDLDHIECAQDKIHRLEQDIKYLRKQAAEREAENKRAWKRVKELEDHVYRLMLDLNEGRK